MKTLLTLAVSILLSGCGTLEPHTLTNAVRDHAAFPDLSIAVYECLARHPDVRAQVTEPWNRLFDKWDSASDLAPDATLLIALGNAPRDMAEAERDAMFIESSIIDAGIDCGPTVRRQWSGIKTTFTELESAIATNQRAVDVIEWTTLLAGILQGRRGEVTRMPTGPIPPS